MRISKRYLLVFAILVAALMVLAACGGGSQAPADEPAPTAAPVEEPAVEEPKSEELAVEEPATGEAVELVFWSMWNENEPQAQVIQGWIEEFQTENPNITISSVWNGRQNQTLVRTALNSGTKIDIVDQDSDPLAGGLMNEGMGYPLDEFLGTPALDEDMAIKDVFVPGVLDLFMGQDGKTYQWPYVYNTVQFWYNKDMFAEVGVEPPQTYEEWLAVNDKLVEAGYAPIAAESDIAFYQIDFLTYYVERVKGPGFLKATVEDPTGEMWNDPVYLEAAKAMRELWDRGHIPEETVGYLWPAGQQTLGFGESAAELVGSWLPIELKDISDFEWGAFNYPAIEGGAGSNNDLQVALLAFMILKDTEHPQEAFEFLRFMMTKENMQKMADEALVGVTRKDVKWAEEIKDGAAAAANAENVMGLSDGTVALYPEFANNILYVNWRDLFLGETTPEEYVQKMATQAADHWAGKEAPAAEPAAEVAPLTDEPVELVFWSMWNENEPQAQVIQGWITDFQAEHPNITISSVWNGRQNQTLVRTALNSGTQIDFVDQDSDPLAGGLMLEGQGYPLDEYLNMPALDEDVAVKDVLVPGVLDLFKGQDGVTYQWPYVYNTVQFWYNKDMFAEVGVEPPQTYDEWLAVNDKLLEAGYAPIAAESDIAFYQIDFLTYFVERVKGPGFLKATVEDKTGEMWNDPVYLQAAQAMRELWDRGHIPEETVGYLWPAGQQTLGFGESAAELVGSWLPIELKDIADFEWGAFNYPAIEGGAGSNNDLQVAMLAFMILKDTEHPRESFEFLRYMMTKENMQAMADEALVGVTRKDVKWADAIADGAAAAANADNVMGLSDGTVALYPEFANNILYVNWRDLFLGETTPEEYVEKMATQAADYWASK